MISAIVYTSHTGHTKEYADLLGRKTGLSVYDLKEARLTLPQGSEIIYLGWLMAGSVKGYAAAKKRFSVKAVCGVGMAPDASQLKDILKVNPSPRPFRSSACRAVSKWISFAASTVS